jgi:ribosomal protein S18 acetylase RimI-like enzyme
MQVSHQSDRMRLAATVDSLTTSTRASLHATTICDRCDEFIVGPRFKCVVCADYDLCSFCMFSNERHESNDHRWSHAFLIIHHPLPSVFRTSALIGTIGSALAESAEAGGDLLQAKCHQCASGRSRSVCLSCVQQPDETRVHFCDDCETQHDQHHLRLRMPRAVSKGFVKALDTTRLPVVPPSCLCAAGVLLPVPQPAQTTACTVVDVSRDPISSTSVIVQAMTVAHVRAVAQLDASCFSSPWPLDGFAELLNSRRHIALVALSGSDVAGAIVVSLARGNKATAAVTSIAVSSAYRRLGVATRLLRCVGDRLQTQQIDKVKLQVGANNLPARRLYERLGFVIDTYLPQYYQSASGPDSGDGILMISKLPFVQRA